MISHRNNNPGDSTMFDFTRSSSMIGGLNTYLSTGPSDIDPIYVVCFDKGEVRSYVAQRTKQPKRVGKSRRGKL